MIKKLIVALTILILLGLGYFLFIERNGVSLEILTQNNLSDQLVENSQVFIERAAALRQIRIDLTLFDDPRFTSLRSYSTPVPTLPIGKPNIFESPAIPTAPTN